MSKLGITVLVVALCVLAATGILLAANTQMAHEDFEENITVSKEGTTTDTVEVNNLSLYPTDSRAYTVHLKCKASGTYGILLDFEEKRDGGLKPYVDVTIKADGKTVFVGQLAALLSGESTPQFSGELSGERPFDIEIIYTMPREVGNEAQNAFADFNVNLTIEKE